MEDRPEMFGPTRGFSGMADCNEIWARRGDPVTYWLVCLSVCHKFQIASSFLFLHGIKPFFGRQFSMTPSTKRCSSIFGLGLLTPKIYSPKFAQNRLSRLVWQTDRICLGLTGGFRGWPIQWNHAKCCGANPCCHSNKIWARHGDPVAYRLVINTVLSITITINYY